MPSSQSWTARSESWGKHSELFSRDAERSGRRCRAPLRVAAKRNPASQTDLGLDGGVGRRQEGAGVLLDQFQELVAQPVAELRHVLQVHHLLEGVRAGNL